MVTFEIKNQTSDRVVYKYYPENKRDKWYGVFSLYLNERRVEIDLVAEEELPIATEDKEWYYYADYVIKRVVEDLKKGNIIESGTVAWL